MRHATHYLLAPQPSATLRNAFLRALARKASPDAKPIKDMVKPAQMVIESLLEGVRT